MASEHFGFKERWLAYFDILGFKRLLENANSYDDLFIIKYDYQCALDNLKRLHNHFNQSTIHFCWFSDTFLIYTVDDTPQSYTIIQSSCKRYITRCIYSRIPLRGALSVGPFYANPTENIFIGQALVDAYKYAEDQDWLGFILTPTASGKVKQYGLDPRHHDFQNENIPMKNYQDSEVFAYTLSSGASSCPSPLLPILNEMKQSAPIKSKRKYENTEQFLITYYKRLTSS